ncbi:MAG TPA: four helix bundle protein [Gemmatimonadaceae bacterium]|nr:four helix bundle protein [Gemmatimonadaceae bacterium]
MNKPTKEVKASDSKDPLWRMRAYQLAAALLDESWPDVEALVQHPGTIRTAGQLYEAVGSIEANLAEGYSRSSGRDRARFFEYSLGSARESLVWYRAARPVIGIETATIRMDKLEEIRRLLIAIVPRERTRTIYPGAARHSPAPPRERRIIRDSE